MKQMTLVALLAFILFGLGCSAESKTDSIEKPAEINLLDEAGGQPAIIKLNGRGLKKGDVLNGQAYSVGSFGGQKCKTKDAEPVMPERVASMSQRVNDAAVLRISEKTFINIGCGKNVSKKMTAGLTNVTITEMKKLVTNKDVWSVTAGKIFICSSIDLSKMTVVEMKADEVYLANAVLTSSNKMAQTLKLTTNKLILDGSNSFSSLLKEEPTPAGKNPMTEVSLTVAQETSGNGTLSIAAKGADCIESENN